MQEESESAHKGASMVGCALSIDTHDFIVGGTVAQPLRAGFVAMRETGKLPWETVSQECDLEYGTDTIEVHTDCLASSERDRLIDELIATGEAAETISGNYVKRKLANDVNYWC